MILYEVYLTFEPSIRETYLVWLQAHLQDMLSFDGFEKVEVYRSTLEPNAVCVHYTVASRKALDDYLEHHAPRMRSFAIEKFGDKFRATRRILEPLNTESLAW